MSHTYSNPKRSLRSAKMFHRLLLANTLLFTTQGCTPPESKSNETNVKDSPRTILSNSNSASSKLDRVTVGNPVKKTLRLYTEQPGRVEPYEQTPILSKISGYIDDVQVDLGDAVKKGQLLISISAPEYLEQVHQKQAIYTQCKAQVLQSQAAFLAAEATARSAQAAVAEMKAKLAKCEADVTRWTSESARIQQLVQSGAVTSKVADETLSELQAAQATKQETLAAIETAIAKEQEAIAKTAIAKTDIEASEAKLNVALADIELAGAMVSYTKVYSPFDGVVTSRNVHTGHYVQPAGTPDGAALLTIADIQRVRVFVNIPESDAQWLDAGFSNRDAGDTVQLNLGGPAAKTIQSRITRSSFQLDRQSRAMTVEIDLDNPDLRVLPGSFVTAKILLEERPDAITLPITAIVKNNESTYCCTVIDGKIHHTPIALGLRVGEEVQILSGLEGNELVVLARASNLLKDQSIETILKK
jgi:HlyD family secretion protein